MRFWVTPLRWVTTLTIIGFMVEISHCYRSSYWLSQTSLGLWAWFHGFQYVLLTSMFFCQQLHTYLWRAVLNGAGMNPIFFFSTRRLIGWHCPGISGKLSPVRDWYRIQMLKRRQSWLEPGKSVYGDNPNTFVEVSPISSANHWKNRWFMEDFPLKALFSNRISRLRKLPWSPHQELFLVLGVEIGILKSTIAI